jgi:thymidylate kinase
MTPLLEADPGALRAPVESQGPRARMLLEFVRELEERRIPHCVLRGQQGFPELHPGGDLDLLTEPRHVRAIVELACAVARRAGVSVWERRSMGFMEQLLLYACAGPGRHEFFGLDVHSCEACFGVPFLEARAVLARTRREHGLLRPEPVLSACIDAVGAWISSGRIPPRHAAAFARVLDEQPAELEDELARWFGARHASGMIAGARGAGDCAQRWPLATLRRALLLRAFRRAPWRSLRALGAYGWAVRVRPWFAPRGRMLAFLGTDGSGKSSVLEAVLAALEPAFGRERLHVFHMRPGLLPQLNALAHAGRTTCTPDELRAPHRAQPSGRLGSAARALYYAADYVLGYAVRVLPLRRRSVIVAFDRYIDDYQVDPLRSRIRRGLPGLAALCRLVPRPEHLFVCSAPLATVRARKQELPEVECARQLVLYEQLARRLPRARLVRTTGSLQEAADEVLRAIFEEERA